jgi:hypothetical protein
MKASAHLFSSLVLSPEAPDLLKIEAARRGLRWRTRKRLADVFELWRDMPSKEAWVKTGNILMRRATELGQTEMARRVAKHLLNSNSLSPESYAAMAALPRRKRPTECRPLNVRMERTIDFSYLERIDQLAPGPP